MTTGKSPAELIFQSRPFRTRLPEFIKKKDDSIVRDKDKANKRRMKAYADKKPYVRNCIIDVGDLVIVRKRRKTKASPYYDPVPYTVTARKGNMITASRNGHRVTRNSSFFKKVKDDGNDQCNVEPDPYDDSDSINGDRDMEDVVDAEGSREAVQSGEADASSDIVVHEADRSLLHDSPPPIVLRRSNRQINTPVRFDDFEM